MTTSRPLIILHVFTPLGTLVVASLANGIAARYAGAVARYRINVGIAWRKLVAVFAVGSASINSTWIVASQRVFTVRYDLQVCRIGTVTHLAQVIGLIPFRDWPNKHLVGQAMCGPLSSFVPYRRVSAAVLITRHLPAGRISVGNERIDANSLEKAPKKLGVYGKSGRVVRNHLSLLFRFDGLGFRGLEHREALSF